MPPQASWAAYTGQSDEAYQGWGWIDAIHPDDRARVAEVWAECVERVTVFEVEYRLRRHDEVWRDMEVRGVPVLAEDGSIREWVGLNIDITARKEAEAAIEHARAAAEAANLARASSWPI